MRHNVCASTLLAILIAKKTPNNRGSSKSECYTSKTKSYKIWIESSNEYELRAAFIPPAFSVFCTSNNAAELSVSTQMSEIRVMLEQSLPAVHSTRTDITALTLYKTRQRNADICFQVFEWSYIFQGG